MPGKLLEVKDLSIGFNSCGKYVKVVDGLSFSLQRGESLGLVGESGCGKTVTAMALVGLLNEKNSCLSGNILVKERAGAAMIFQDSFSSLNPVLTVKSHLLHLIKFHHGLGSAEALEKACHLLNLVGIDNCTEVLRKYPWELSGGMAQRVCIALALCPEPRILIADEPTTALDTLTGAVVMKTLGQLREKLDLTLMIISHDLATIARNCSRLLIMYTGRVVEEGPTQDLLTNPVHPYTQKLVNTFLALEEGRYDLEPIQGYVPSYYDLPVGCSFHPRCQEAAGPCFIDRPPMQAYSLQRHVACHFRRNPGERK